MSAFSTCSASIYEHKLKSMLNLGQLLQEAKSFVDKPIDIDSDTSDDGSFLLGFVQADEHHGLLPKNAFAKYSWMNEVLETSDSEDEWDQESEFRLDSKILKSQQHCFNKLCLASKNTFKNFQQAEKNLLDQQLLDMQSATKRKPKDTKTLSKKLWKQVCKEVPKSVKARKDSYVEKKKLRQSLCLSLRDESRAKGPRVCCRHARVITQSKRMLGEAQFFYRKYILGEKTARRRTRKHITKTMDKTTQAYQIRKTDSSTRKAEEKLKELLVKVEHHARKLSNNQTRSFQGNCKSIYAEKSDIFAPLKSYPQPEMLHGHLSNYQLVGLNWLANLYNHKVNGILADDVGLGKTVQAISFLAHLAEVHNVWGPFLVVAPSSIVNNWYQEFVKFVPEFEVLPYWGSTAQRKDLCLKWRRGRKKGRDNKLSFHVLLTTYAIYAQDQHNLDQEWQYIIYDQAQALESSASEWWKKLMKVRGHYRLLITSTPVKNSLQELWGLICFIMPELFDNHLSYHCWFNKAIEAHIENKASLAIQTYLQRLHVFLAPLILRRLKSDVKHELVVKVERNLLCELTARQKLMYDDIKNKACMLGTNVAHVLKELRKVCNHPDLHQGHLPRTSFRFSLPSYHVSQLIYLNFITKRGNKKRLLYNDLNIHQSSHINACTEQTFSFLKHMSVSLSEYVGLYRSYDFTTAAGFVRTQLAHLKLKHKRRFCDIPVSSYTILLRCKFANTPALSEMYNFIATTQNCPPRLVRDTYLERAICSKTELYCHHFSFHPIYKQPSPLRELVEAPCKAFVNFPTSKQLIADSGKLRLLDRLLPRLKRDRHRVLVYSHMSEMIDLLEHYMKARRFTYSRLDSSCPIATQRDKAANLQAWSGSFVFLMSAHTGSLSINLTAADTVIFYDSEPYNASKEQQAVERVHWFGQTKQVTVYQLVCRNTVDQKILECASKGHIMRKTVITSQSAPNHSSTTLINHANLLDDDIMALRYCSGIKKSVNKSLERTNDSALSEVAGDSDSSHISDPGTSGLIKKNRLKRPNIASLIDHTSRKRSKHS